MRPVDQLPRGAALLEVLLGFALLAIAGIAWLTLAGQVGHSVRNVRSSEQATLAASATMEWLAIRAPADLSALAGRRRIGGFDVTVAQLLPHLYDVRIDDTLSGSTLLHSSIYATYAADSIR